MGTEPQELRQEIEDLKTAHAAQTAAQAAQMETMSAMQARTIGALVAGGVSLVAGMLMGIIIARAGQRRLL